MKERPVLPDPTDDADDAMEGRIRYVLVSGFTEVTELLLEDLRRNPSHSVRGLRLIGKFADLARAGVAELALEDDDVGSPGEEDGFGMGQARPLRRVRAAGGMAGGHAYGVGDVQGEMHMAIRAQRMDALTRTIERTGPDGPSPNAAVHAAAEREIEGMMGIVPVPPPVLAQVQAEEVLDPGPPPRLCGECSTCGVPDGPAGLADCGHATCTWCTQRVPPPGGVADHVGDNDVNEDDF